MVTTPMYDTGTPSSACMDRPAGAEQRIRQAEADKRKIDKCQQQRIHILYHLDGAVLYHPDGAALLFGHIADARGVRAPYR